MREQYETLLGNPAAIEKTLLAGAVKARELSRPFMARLRQAVGLRPLAGIDPVAPRKAAKATRPSFKQYREKDGLFYFKFLDESGNQLLQSRGFASPQEAGRAIGMLRQQRGAALALAEVQLEAVDKQTLNRAAAALEVLAAETGASEK